MLRYLFDTKHPVTRGYLCHLGTDHKCVLTRQIDMNVVPLSDGQILVQLMKEEHLPCKAASSTSINLLLFDS